VRFWSANRTPQQIDRNRRVLDGPPRVAVIERGRELRNKERGLPTSGDEKGLPQAGRLRKMSHEVHR
jgi:hypothetical protein